MYESLAMLAAANATQPATSATLNNLLPAILGFVGVFVGALLNVAAKRRNFNEEQVAIIRERVGELAVSIQEFTTTAKQTYGVLGTKSTHFTNEGTAILTKHGNQLFEKLGHEYFRIFRLAQSQTILLMSARDAKVAAQAQAIHDEIITYHVTYNDLFDYRVPEASERLTADSNELAMLANNLLTMVGPRRYESFWRFRREATAKREIAQHLSNLAKVSKGSNS